MNFSMRIMVCLLVSTGLISCKSSDSSYPKLVNPEASQKAVKLYQFLQDIQGKYTLSGQHNFCGKGSDYTDQLEVLTGKKALIWGSDFSFCVKGEDAMRFQHCGPANLPAFSMEAFREETDSTGEFTLPPLDFLDITLEEARNQMIEEAKRRYAQGHIITLMWHGCYPTEGECCNGSSIWAMEKRPTPEAWDSLVTEGTPLNKAWKEQADEIAGYLRLLQDADIPVLWRPYHEMNGVWFWWCNQKGEQGFKRLWIMMYNYFTIHHKLNNLIWVWNTNAPRDIPNDEAWAYELFYPGDNYVDILAADVYRKDYKQSHHDQLVALGNGKPIALGEVGEIPSPEILEQQPHWTWYMPWAWILFVANQPDDIKALMNCEKVLTLDEISRDGKGNYEL